MLTSTTIQNFSRSYMYAKASREPGVWTEYERVRVNLIAVLRDAAAIADAPDVHRESEKQLDIAFNEGLDYYQFRLQTWIRDLEALDA